MIPSGIQKNVKFLESIFKMEFFSSTFSEQFLENSQIIDYTTRIFYHLQTLPRTVMKKSIPNLLKLNLKRLRFYAERCQNIGKIRKRSLFYIFRCQNISCLSSNSIQDIIFRSWSNRSVDKNRFVKTKWRLEVNGVGVKAFPDTFPIDLFLVLLVLTPPLPNSACGLTLPSA